jgi:hypothetical protein
MERSRTVMDLMADGIATAVGKDGDMPTRWVAVVETLDVDGKQCVWRMVSDGLTSWDAAALHDYALTKLRARMARDATDD